MIVTLLTVAATLAQAPAALLFTYKPHDGMAAEFHEGYRRHLDWHRAHDDTLVWYGWEVITGDRLGVFVDGTFGRPFAAIDRRPDPAGDQADFAATAGPYAAPIGRTAFVLRAELGTATPLERGQPTFTMEAIFYDVRPGTESRFESAALAAREIAVRNGLAVTWYRLVNGGRHATYLQAVHRPGLSGFDVGAADLVSLIEQLPDTPQRTNMLLSVSESMTGSTSEIWRFLPESSLIP